MYKTPISNSYFINKHKQININYNHKQILKFAKRKAKSKKRNVKTGWGAYRVHLQFRYFKTSM